ncbi:hypothetical protein GCM10009533_16180 [Saccharopolyspora spinosporotrichia]|uniref:Uncharacterized protein n=1 Tax=Saccharopolyspora erythraea TaxID=1836 RepID=A0ABN1CEX1_SACER|nr:hypothetical protein N599_11665 [Saccharopolyspora erythraea D]
MGRASTSGEVGFIANSFGTGHNVVLESAEQNRLSMEWASRSRRAGFRGELDHPPWTEPAAVRFR